MIDDSADYPSQFLADVYEKLNGESVSVESHDAITELDVMEVKTRNNIRARVKYRETTPEKTKHYALFDIEDLEDEVENRDDITI